MPLSPRETLLARVGSISVPVSVPLCQRRMTLGEFLSLRPGSFIPFFNALRRATQAAR